MITKYKATINYLTIKALKNYRETKLINVRNIEKVLYLDV